MESGNNLFNFVISGNCDRVRSLLETGAEVNIRDKMGFTPLLRSIEIKNFDMCKLLLDHGANPNFCGQIPRFDKINQIKMLSPLMLTAALNEPKLLNLLLKHKADVNFKDSVGYSAIDVAAIHESKNCIKILLDSGAYMDDNMKSSLFCHLELQEKVQHSPLYRAARNENWESFTKSLEQTSDVNVTDQRKNTILNIVVYKGNITCTELLLKKGADPSICNVGNNTPLHTAAGIQSSACIEMLLQYNADVNATGFNKFTPLHMVLASSILPVNFMDVFFLQGCRAASNTVAHKTHDILNCIKILLKANADIFAKDSHGFFPLHTAAQCGPAIFAEVLGNDINICNSEGVKPIHIVSAMTNVSSLEYVLSKGANVNALTKSGDTPLHAACQNLAVEYTDGESMQHEELIIVHMLVQKGCNVNKQNKQGQTALHLCIQNDFYQKFKYLLNCEADLNLPDKDMKTALHYAAENGKLKYAMLLIHQGVNVTVLDKSNHTPLMIAAKKCNFDLVRLLLINNALLW